MKITVSKFIIVAAFAQSSVNAFSVAPKSKLTTFNPLTQTFHISPSTTTTLFSTPEPTEDEIEVIMEKTKLTEEEVEKVGNLVADDEWLGLGMELSEMVRIAVIEQTKKNTADFIGKEDYKVGTLLHWFMCFTICVITMLIYTSLFLQMGDITKEIDSRVKVSSLELCCFVSVCIVHLIVSHNDFYYSPRQTEVAKIRGKDNYELGDLTMALDQISKDMTCKMTGKEDYEGKFFFVS